MPVSVMLLVLLGALLHASWNGLIKAGSDRYLDMVGVLTGAALLALCWLPFLPSPALASWPYLAASTAIHQIYFFLIVFSYRKGEMSLVYPLTRGTAPALTALFSVAALAERPSAGGWLGVGLISGGVLLLSFENRRSKNFQWAPVLLALANAGIIMLYTLLDGTGARLSGNAVSYTGWGFVLCALLFAPPALLLRGRASLIHFRQEWRRSLIGGGCSVFAYSTALWAMTVAPIALIAALRETSILFGVLIAAFTLHERIGRVRILAVFLVAAGAAALRWN